MIPYSQADKKWAHLKLGDTDLDMKTYGCFVTSLAIIDERPPDEALNILNRNRCFNSDGFLLSDCAAKTLGLSYKGKVKKRPLADGLPCVIETSFYAPAYPQHFCVLLDEHRIVDPLDGKEQFNKYKDKIISYRLFKKKKGAVAFTQPVKPIVEPKPITITTTEKTSLWSWIKDVIHRFSKKSA